MKKKVCLLVGLVLVSMSAIVRNTLSSTGKPVRPPPTARDPEEVRLATEALLSEPATPLNISPDGSRLLMQIQEPSGYSLILVDRATGSAIATLPTGGRPRLSAWSPDGGKIAYATDGGSAEYQLWFWDLETRKAVRPRVPTTHIVTQAKWAASGRFLTHVVEHKGDPRTLYRVEAREGAVPIEVARSITAKASMAWSPDGTAIATVRSDAPDAVTIIDSSGREKSVRFEEGAEIRDLAYSPDGRTLLLTARRKGEQHFRLAAGNVAARSIRVMPTPPVAGDVVSPFFVPGALADARGIIYRVYPGDEKLIFSCNRDGLECRRLGPGTGQVTPWAASPDGRSLFVGQLFPKAVHQVDIATGTDTPIYQAARPEGVGEDGGQISVASFDGLGIPVHFRRGKPVPGMEPALFVQVLGGIGKESPAPWDSKAEYLYRRGITVLKVYVRGKAGFGRTLQDAPGGHAERVKDILAVLDHAVRVLKIPPGRIVLFGHSDGALLAVKAAAAEAPIGSLVISSMVKDSTATPPILQSRLERRCAVAFQGSQDSLTPDLARAQIEAILGPNATREPCGRFQALEGEAHELERAASWGEVFAAIVTALKNNGTN